MKCARSWWVAAVLVICGGWSGEALAEGYFERYYESFWHHPRYQNEYHGYWRDLGYGFSNRPVYGSYYRAERYYDPYGPQLRRHR